MATCDVPGTNPANNDDLHIGCWGEADDDSLIFVEGVSNAENRVIYSIFDMSNKNNPFEYRDSMPKDGFEKMFSKDSSGKWTWHDKTPFPWEGRIMNCFPDGQRIPSAKQIISAAKRIATSRNLIGHPIKKQDYKHMVKQIISKTGDSIINKLQKALDKVKK